MKEQVDPKSDSEHRRETLNNQTISLLTLDDIVQMTLQTGGSWAIAHARRLMEIIREIGIDVSYDVNVLTLAAYLHDWGAFPTYLEKNVEHALRSRQVVEAEISPRLGLSNSACQILLEAIELHDYRDQRLPHSSEALLLREADMLEFLGMMGMAREFARGPKDVEICYRRIISRRTGIEGRFTLPRAQETANIRLEHMTQCLKWLKDESYGIL
jgi:uncharacterized protein